MKLRLYILILLFCCIYANVSAQGNVEVNNGIVINNMGTNKKELDRIEKRYKELEASQEKIILELEKIAQRMAATDSTYRYDIIKRDSVNKIFSIRQDSLNNELRRQNDSLTAKDKLIATLKEIIQIQQKNKFVPLGIKQFESSRILESVRGGVYAVGQVGGLVGSIYCGAKWNAKKCDYKNLEAKYNNEPYLNEREKIKKQLNDTNDEIGKYKRGFWISLGVMVGAYGFNVLDNCFWTKPNKNIGIKLQCNEISLNYNF